MASPEPAPKVQPTITNSRITIIAISQVSSRNTLSPALPGGARAARRAARSGLKRRQRS